MTSLGVSPSLTSRSRPTPPGRAKRNSLTPTLRANIAPGPTSPGVTKRSGLGGKEKSVGMMGGLRERTEDEVRRAGRDELISALKGEWEAREKMNEHVDALEGERRRLEKEREELRTSLGGLQVRVDEAFNEQSRLEADLEGRDELLDKMRGRISDSEKQLRDGQKRYSEQERSFEAEREAFRAQETHLQTRIKTLSSIASTSKPSVSPTTNESLELLQEELASLSASHCTLIAQLNTVSSELGDLKERNKTLEEENAGWELLMRERTLNGGMRGKGLLGEEWLDEGGEDEVGKTEMEALEEEMEMGSSVSDVKIGRGKLRGECLGDLPITSGGLDLAAELGRAEVGSDGNEMGSLGKGDEGDALRAEVKALRDSNKALTLYCSKIIDRIIAQEGFEHILAVDYKTRRLQTQRSKVTGATRTTVHDLISNMQRGDVPPPVPSLPSLYTPIGGDVKAIAPVKKARPMSMMARAFSTGPPVAEERKSEEMVKSPILMEVKTDKEKDEEAKAAKKAKRGFSIDFRSFGFGSAPPPPAPPPAEPKGLKPLQLPRLTASQSRPPSVRNLSPPMTSPIDYAGLGATARKLDPQAEDEEDRRERHRMEAAMRLMGIDRTCLSPSPGSITEEIEEPEMCSPSVGKPRSSTGSESMSSISSKTGTSLTRLSSHLSGGGSTLSPSLELKDPMSPVTMDSAVEAFAAFDKKEQEQVKMISKGNYQAGYTSLSASIRDRRQSMMRRGSSQSSDGAQRAMNKGKLCKSESISTLWSAGSESRRGSVAEILADGELPRV